MNALGVINLITALTPSSISLVQDLIAVFHKHDVTPDQQVVMLQALVMSTQAEDAATLAAIKADQAK